MLPVTLPSFGGGATVGGIATSYPFQPGVDVLSPPPPATATTLASNGTIPVSGPGATSIRVTEAGAVTGIILAVGLVDQQPFTVLNEAAYSITFAAEGTSHVANGTSAVIASLEAATFVWNAQYNSGAGAWFLV